MIRTARARLSAWIKAPPVGLALLLGLALRLIGIEQRSFQYDDAFSIFLSARSIPEIVRGTAADTMPPLYYIFLHFWMVVGQQVWFIRLLSVFFSLAIVLILYLLVKHWFGEAAAGWAALIAAVSPFQIYHAQDVRMYALLALGQIGYIWFATRIWFSAEAGQEHAGDWIGLAACGLVSMYSHNLAVFAIIVPDVFLLLQRRWKLLARFLAAQLVIGLASLPWLLLLPGQLEKVQRAFWTPRPGPVEVIQAIILFTASMPLPPALLVIAAVLSFQILILLAFETWRFGRRDQGIVFLAALLLVPPVLLFFLSYVMRPVFVARGFLVSSLAYYGLAGYAISRAWSHGSGKLIAAGFVLAAVLTLPSFYRFEEFPRSPYREAAVYLDQVRQPSSLIIHETKLSYFPMRFYAPVLPQVFIADSPGSPNDTFAYASQQAMNIYPQPDLASAAGSHDNIFFITYSQVFRELQDSGQAEHPAVQWLNSHYQQVNHTVFNDLEIFQYER